MSESEKSPFRIAVVIPSYKVSAHLLPLLGRIGPEVQRIFVVDDKCPEGSGALVSRACADPRVKVIFHAENQGVGGATLSGFRAAQEEGLDIAVKLDGDGQMDPSLLPVLVEPLVRGEADFAKGNRFFRPRDLREMPVVRLIGNSGISFFAKLATGYWNVMDTTNGFVGLHLSVLPVIDAEKIEKRYFFENDLLFRLGIVRAVVREVPMVARYGDEVSNLSVTKSLFTFPGKFLSRIGKRIFYSYYLRDFSVASLLLLAGTSLTAWGALFGAFKWLTLSSQGVMASSGTVMLAGLPVILGIQMLLSAMLYDISAVPTLPIHPALRRQAKLARAGDSARKV